MELASIHSLIQWKNKTIQISFQSWDKFTFPLGKESECKCINHSDAESFAVCLI